MVGQIDVISQRIGHVGLNERVYLFHVHYKEQQLGGQATGLRPSSKH